MYNVLVNVILYIITYCTANIILYYYFLLMVEASTTALNKTAHTNIMIFFLLDAVVVASWEEVGDAFI